MTAVEMWNAGRGVSNTQFSLSGRPTVPSFPPAQSAEISRFMNRMVPAQALFATQTSAQRLPENLPSVEGTHEIKACPTTTFYSGLSLL